MQTINVVSRVPEGAVAVSAKQSTYPASFVAMVDFKVWRSEIAGRTQAQLVEY